MNVKIYGAGSIGNHLANAAISIGWNVDVFDIDKDALHRMKNEVYPQRYGKWNSKIGLYGSENKKNYDLILIGTPPDTHADLLLSSIKQRPKAIMVEKPLCCPDIKEIKLLEGIDNDNISIFIGYDHIVGPSTQKITQILQSNMIGEIQTIDVEFRENWSGIFRAHPWLDGPSDTYLGYWKRGGGASGEHSHALNLWQYFARISGCGSIEEIDCFMDFHKDKVLDYDKLCLMNIKTESGIYGRVVQDVIYEPSKKKCIIQGSKGRIELDLNFKQNNDRVTIFNEDGNIKKFDFEKTRPDDFIYELKHISKFMVQSNSSPISLRYGIETMKVLYAAHLSNIKKHRVTNLMLKNYFGVTN